ncbi:hypothetical protein EPO66_05285, partial [bacterium]
MRNKPLKYCLITGMLLYLFLCAVRFISAKPLWLDENFILSNIRELSPPEIFGPLKHAQGFPRVYLFLIQGCARAFSYNIYSLRMLPFACMISSFFIWLSIYKREEGKGIGFLLFILSWCGSYFMSNYSSELKQYSMDVLAAAIFSWFILRQKYFLSAQKIMLSLQAGYLLLPSLVLLSYTGYFFVLLPAYNLILNLKGNKPNKAYLSVYTASLIVCIFLSYHFDLRYTLADQGLRGYWKDYFISTSSVYEFVKSFTEGLRNIFVRWFLERKPVTYIMTIFMPLGLFYMFFSVFKRIKGDKAAILSLGGLALVLLMELFLAGMMKVYPFTGARVTLFM